MIELLRFDFRTWKFSNTTIAAQPKVNKKIVATSNDHTTQHQQKKGREGHTTRRRRREGEGQQHSQDQLNQINMGIENT